MSYIRRFQDSRNKTRNLVDQTSHVKFASSFHVGVNAEHESEIITCEVEVIWLCFRGKKRVCIDVFCGL